MPTRSAKTHRRERHGVPVVPRDRPDRVAYDEVRVRRRDPDAVRHGQFELAGRVLRVELHHTGALLLEGPDQRGRERLDVGERDRAVRGPRVGRRRVRLVRTRCGAMAQEELDLVAAAKLETVAGEALEHPTGERAGAARVRLALLVELIDRCESPSRARGEPDRLGGIGHQPRVARRSGDVRRGGDLIVDLEDREDRRQADPELDRVLEPAERDRLHEGDSGVDHQRERDRLDAGGGEAARGLRRASAARLGSPPRSSGGTQNSSRYSVRSQSETASLERESSYRRIVE